MNLAPIALFAYNRPEHLRASLAALVSNPLAAESHLYLYSDGPKDDISVPLVESVRSIARKVEGFRAVTVVEREGNIGLVASITGEVKRLCVEFGRVIVLEDDLITAPFFLSYMKEALERFENEARVMQVSGYMYPIPARNGNRATFLPATSCWGWATWRRAWDAYDPTMRGFDELKADPARRRAFNLDGHYDYVDLLSAHIAGRINSWGVIWHLNVFLKGGLTVYPSVSLVSNNGFDGSGTHAQNSDLGRIELRAETGEVVWPEAIEVDQAAYSDVKKVIRTSKRGLRHWLRNLFPV